MTHTAAGTMHVVVIGSGGREHAVVRALAKSARTGKITAIPGNSGIAREAACVDLDPSDIAAVVAWCTLNAAGYVVVTPDNPLALGMVDALEAAGIPAFGPRKAAAQIEASKAYAKSLMRRYGIPTAVCEVCTESAAALSYARGWFQKTPAKPLVVKADGLALGKGVRICATFEESARTIEEYMGGRFGESGKTVLLEECLAGPEVSVLSFCDGTTVVPMISSMDHKRARDGDEGENTGGMGAVAPNPYYTPEIAAFCMEKIYRPSVAMLAACNAPFSGCLYFGLMLTSDGPKVIEYNSRFGDPEAQTVIPLLESDLLEIMLACTEGRLRPQMVKFSQNASCCVVLASDGYPGACETGFPITGIQAASETAAIYHAATTARGGQFYNAGGRVLGVSSQAATLPAAIKAAYHAAGKIHWQNMYYRRDIGRSVCGAGRISDS
ncbi:MAG: phosphoribosylamine--glycine ligase [Spirochaetaceae bacterium]|jgi:phosphoribosylamine--glycine ligase|nr:phosphoribosylamine--glycine ligase [Spirochaetaceae bacterium]